MMEDDVADDAGGNGGGDGGGGGGNGGANAALGRPPAHPNIPKHTPFKRMSARLGFGVRFYYPTLPTYT
jgi:hypothetical protein